ncbi:hypothetical protein IEO70_18530 [Bacillus sp. AGMB 02131]|uniref:Uncharacterized protein n=1 Tax=Peribacillus faecalis TaxID=2772559 RepID=A0A927CZ22_9BACI|nr:hypothetical protein [Peribacillus faecalis]MBD3110326.1 hypothetical protein [Peribacillus faecalis]
MKNVVYGVYRFLGFHICSYLLENGEEVVGYDWDPEDMQAEEKQLMIGRNANFSYCDEQWTSESEAQLLICLFDYLQNPINTENQFQQIIDDLDLFLEKIQKERTEIVVFLPEQVLDHFHCTLSEWRIKMNQDYAVRYVYVSELYGPWLPSFNAMTKIMRKEKTVLKENMSKYIYIDDFLRSWKDLMAINKSEIIVAGKQNEQWQQDLKLYVAERGLVFAEQDYCEIEADLLIEAKTSLVEGIKLMEEHEAMLNMLRKRF